MEEQLWKGQEIKDAGQADSPEITERFLQCVRFCEFKKCCKKYKRGKRCKKCPKKE